MRITFGKPCGVVCWVAVLLVLVVEVTLPVELLLPVAPSFESSRLKENLFGLRLKLATLFVTYSCRELKKLIFVACNVQRAVYLSLCSNPASRFLSEDVARGLCHRRLLPLGDYPKLVSAGRKKFREIYRPRGKSAATDRTVTGDPPIFRDFA